MRVTVGIGLYELLEQHARASLPMEACGLLGVTPGAGGDVTVARFVPTRNTANEVDRFAIDPLETARADAELRAAGLRLGGTFHSHPGSDARPSASDQASCGAGLIHQILSIQNQQGRGQLTAWQQRGGELVQLTLRVCADPGPRGSDPSLSALRPDSTA